MNYFLVLRAYLWLIQVHIVLSARGFAGLHRKMAGGKCGLKPRGDLAMLTRSFLAAQRLYIKQAKCLHSSAACVLFLRAGGFPAQMKIGVQQRPFFAHAWVELNGAVVTGTIDPGMYVVIDSL